MLNNVSKGQDFAIFVVRSILLTFNRSISIGCHTNMEAGIVALIRKAFCQNKMTKIFLRHKDH